MKIKLDKQEKIELLKAVAEGVLNTNAIERITTEIKGQNAFLDLMMSLPDPEQTDENN